MIFALAGALCSEKKINTINRICLQSKVLHVHTHIYTTRCRHGEVIKTPKKHEFSYFLKINSFYGDLFIIPNKCDMSSYTLLFAHTKYNEFSDK